MKCGKRFTAVNLVLEGLNLVPFGSVPLNHPPDSNPCRGMQPALRYSRLERRLNFLFFILVVSWRWDICATYSDDLPVPWG
jgi:hypothetical protein